MAPISAPLGTTVGTSDSTPAGEKSLGRSAFAGCVSPFVDTAAGAWLVGLGGARNWSSRSTRSPCATALVRMEFGVFVFARGMHRGLLLHPPFARVDGEARAVGEGRGGVQDAAAPLPGSSPSLASDPPKGREKSKGRFAPLDRYVTDRFRMSKRGPERNRPKATHDPEVIYMPSVLSAQGRGEGFFFRHAAYASNNWTARGSILFPRQAGSCM